MKNVEIDDTQVASTQPVTAQPAPTPTNSPDTSMKVTTMKQQQMMMMGILITALVAGTATGFGIFKLSAKGFDQTNPEIANIKEGSPTGAVQVGDVYGSSNEDIFKDSAEGVVQAGGIEGEGTHQLVRPGGESQTVYVTSSVVDMDQFVGSKVKVWGETNTAQKAGWLMDVGRVKVIELNSALPEE